MATNHNRTLYKDYLSAVLAKEDSEKQVRILKAQCERKTINRQRLYSLLVKRKQHWNERLPGWRRCWVLTEPTAAFPPHKRQLTKRRSYPTLGRKRAKWKAGSLGTKRPAGKSIRIWNHRRIQLEAKGITEFSREEVENFFTILFSIIQAAVEESEKTPAKYGGDEERALLVRLAEYRDAYFAWVTNFDLPTTNNVSERALRGCKTKMKVSGQFQATESARNYAIIKTYLETCVRNGINEIDALNRLCLGLPYAVNEIFSEGCE